uniref:Uncharacterized protein n=1 Tax=Molossus molossus TaxID=27622 RepID=A0A7J8C566_MOLMO|nr:hypothetical protein HJG59_000117 [Molossus molossus]
MGCHSSKTTKVVVEPQAAGEQPQGEAPDLEASAEAADGKVTPLTAGVPEPQS